MSSNTSVGLVIPAYNPDVQTFEQYITEMKSSVNQEKIRIEIDMPFENIESHLSEKVDYVNSVHRWRDKSAAITHRFDSLDTDIIAFADSDGSVLTSSVENIINKIISTDVGVNIGLRRHPASEIISHQTIFGRLLDDGFAFVARHMLPTRCYNYQCGAKAVSADAWDMIRKHCYEPGFAWDLEFVFITGSLGYKITKVPIKWEDLPKLRVSRLTATIELATALVDVRRRTDALNLNPRHSEIQSTTKSRLSRINQDEN